MTINITEFVNATISVSPTGVATGNFGILGFLTNEAGILVPQRGKTYTSLAEVTADWATSTEVYKAAVAFYGQTPTPRDFTVLSVYEVDQAAILVGGLHDTLANLILLTAGNFEIEVDGTTATVTFDASAATTLAEVATAITTGLSAALLGATCTYGDYGFIITSDTTGSATSSLGYASGTNSDDLGFSQHQATLSAIGLDAETPVAALAAAVDKGLEFIGLVTHKKFRDQTAQLAGSNTVDIADWCEAASKLFCNTTNDLSTLNSATSTDVGSQLKLKTLNNTLTNFAKNINQYVSASVFGRVASVNFEGIATTITLNLKQMPTITAENLTSGELAVLRSKNVNAVVVIGKSANAYTDSRMASGSWMDTRHGLLWLENRIETDMFNLLYQSNTKIPFTATGLNIAEDTLEQSLIAAVRNGLAAPGYLPDGTYLPNGYSIARVALADVPAGDKSGRVYRGFSFKMVGAGALHEVGVTGEFSE